MFSNKVLKEMIVPLFLEHGKIAEESNKPKEFFAHPATEREKAFLKMFDYELKVKKEAAIWLLFIVKIYNHLKEKIIIQKLFLMV